MKTILFLSLYVLYIVALVVGYRFVVRKIEKNKLRKKLEQEDKIKRDV